MSSDLPCRLATVRSSGMRMLISDRSSAYSFACSLRLRQTISNASCMYIVAELLLRKKKVSNVSRRYKEEYMVYGTYTEIVVYRCAAASAVS